jgi:hypothetical protein
LSYRVDGVEQGDACAAVSELCSSADPLALMGPEACTETYATAQSSYCELNESCESTAELRSGVTATLTTSKYASCSELDGRQRCSCSNGSVSRTYDISEATGVSSCEIATDLCDSDEQLVFDGAIECEVGYQDASDGYCELQQECSRSAALRDNVTALLFDSQYFNCYDNDANGTYCNCSGNQWSLGFLIPGRVADAAACEDARTACARPQDIALTGSVECARSSQSANTDYCDAQITCTHPASWGDLPLVMNSAIYLNCQRASSGSWGCSCSAGMQSSNFDVEGGDGWDVCTAATERCPDLIDVTSLDSGTTWTGMAYY